MATTDGRAVRVRFLVTTRDEHGNPTHEAGEEICGELIQQNRDFLLVRTTAGRCMYVDASRLDLYCIDRNPEDLLRPLAATQCGKRERSVLRAA